MAYQQNWRDEEVPGQQPGAGGQNTSGIVGGNTASNAAQPATGGTASNPSAAQQPGTGFVNLQSYLDANKDAGAKTAAASTADLSKQAADYGATASNTAKSASFNDGSGALPKLKAGLTNDATAAASAKQAEGYMAQKAVDPTASAGNVTAGLKADGTALQSQLGSVDDPNNVQAALANTYSHAGGGNYNKGFGLLDQFLEQGTQGGRDVLAGVKAKGSDVQNAYNNAYGAVQDKARAANAQLSANKQDLMGAAAVKFGALGRQGQDKLNAFNTGVDTSTNDGKARASLGDVLNPQQAQEMAALAHLTHYKGPADWGTSTYKEGTPVAPTPTTPTPGPGAGPDLSPGINWDPSRPAGVAQGAVQDAAGKATPYLPGPVATAVNNDPTVSGAMPGIQQADDATSHAADVASNYVPKLKSGRWHT